MTDLDDSFRQQVAADPKTKAQWLAISDEILSTVESEYGVSLAREDLLSSSAIRLNVLADAGLDWRSDIEALPAVAQAIASKRLLEALSDPKNDRHEAAMASVYDELKPEQRIAAVRAMNAAPSHVRGSRTKRDLTVEEKEAALRELRKLPRSMQLAAARKAGLE